MTNNENDSGRSRRIRLAAMLWDASEDRRKTGGREIITSELSPDGIRFSSDRIYAVGAGLRADIYFPGRAAPVVCTLKVTRVEAEVNQDTYVVSAAFGQIREEDKEAVVAALNKLDLYQMLVATLKAGATDLHLTVGSPPMIRRHGSIGPLTTDLVQRGEIEAMLYPLLTQVQIQNFEERRELDFAFSPTVNTRFRVNLHWQRGYVEAALRNIPTKIKSFSELGVPVEPMQEFCKQKAGLILITGATGSGKTTSLSAMVHYINTIYNYIVITVEDPIEYLHTSRKSVVKQRELGTDTLSYAAALRHVLRQDPDVICVGELLDGECLKAAMRAAETGHLVLSTIHAPNTAQAIQRAVNFFPPEHAPNICQQLSTCLIGILFQTLLPSPSRGRVPATELLMNNSAMANLIREGKFSQMATVLQTARAQGMYTLKSSLQDLHDRGLIEASVLEGFRKLDYSQ